MDEQKINKAFAMIEAVAINGGRCPQNDDLPFYRALDILAHIGKIRIEISGRNWRQVFLIEGPHVGKATAPNPHGHIVWMIIGKETVRKGQLLVPGANQQIVGKGRAARERRLRAAERQRNGI
jgi:hypothetical protein